MSPVAFNIFGLDIRWYGVLIASAMLIGSMLALRECRRIGFDENYILDIILYCVPAAIIGARFYYVIFQWDSYKNNIIDIFAIRNGGLAIHGGIIGAVIAALIYTRIRNLSFLKIADICAPSLVLGQAIGRWGNFFNQEAYGGAVNKEFISHFPKFIQQGMLINGTYYHPTFLYESMWDFMVFIIIFLYRKRNKRDGYVFFIYLILYSTGRFFVEGMRLDSLMLGHFRMAQFISIAIIIFSLVCIQIIKKRKSIM